MSLLTTIAIRGTVLILAIAASAGQVAYLDALSWQMLGLSHTLGGDMRPPLLTLITAHAVVSVFSGALALALAFRPGKDRDAASSLGIALAVWSYLLAYPGIVVLFRPDPGVWRTLFETHFLLVEALGLAGLVRFTSLFPIRLTVEDLGPLDALPLVLRPFQIVRGWLLGATAPWVAAGAIPILLFALSKQLGTPLGDAGLNPVMDLARFAVAALVVVNLRSSWSLAPQVLRERVTWLVVGLALLISALVILIGGNILMAVTGWPEPVIAWRPILLDLGAAGFVGGIASALLYTGRLNAPAVARRIVSVSALLLLSLFLATGLEALLSGAIAGRISLPNGLGSVLALMIIGTSHRPLLRFFERLIGPNGDVDSGDLAVG